MLPGSSQSPRDNGGWDVMEQAFREGNALCQQNDIELVMLFVPMKLHVMGPRTQFNARTARELAASAPLTEADRLPAWLKPLCDELDIRFVDATEPLLARARRGELVYLPFDTHFSPLGHEIVADLLSDALGPAQAAASTAPPPR